MLVQVDGISDVHRQERLKCKTDLWYLSTDYLECDLVESVHREACDFFVKKDPTKPFEEQDRIHDRLWLDPREHYKTTIDVCDAIQWLVTFPNLRIAFFSGTEELVKQIVEMAIYHFKYNDKFKELFFEHAIEKSAKTNVFDFDTPARTQRNVRGHSLTGSTISSEWAGTHFEVLKLDDIVTDKNCDNPDMIEKVKRKVRALIPLCMVGGYRDFIGTRYDPSDAYGEKIDKLEEPKVVREIPFGTVTYTKKWKVLNRRFCTLPLSPKSEFLFPFRKDGVKNFTYEVAMDRLKEMEPRQFGCQYLNDPLWGETSSITEELFDSCVKPLESFPLLSSGITGQVYKTAKVFIAWDLAFSVKKHADFTAGAVGAYDRHGNLFIIDMELGRFSPDEMVLKMLTLLRKWYPFMGRVGIENAGGSQLIGPMLKSASANFRIPLQIDWLPTSPESVKAERIFGLIPLMKTGRFYVSSTLPYLEEVRKQFIRYRPKGGYKDDAPDAISRLLHYQSWSESVATDIEAEQQQQLFESQVSYSPSPIGYGLVG